ncbi:S-adenosyl-L-methionine-dependent methyltransferase [Arabidopsis suecica]|uniref:S-adenosyl-L-methionine-dependent methyltransferase n=1 Tax=Arabidopsis suecica TaxID=45249 RepID=A0A8T2EA48_ARASU|nr:S-adenosyl-L-methionine-dependent methyltransferase [Arabidopsis suecica]KAG7620300.1 S-adenosyl-L-methionine-dependent methyltransferase [Arabidopsis suecica]
MNSIQRFSLTTRRGKRLSVVKSCVRHFCGRDVVIKDEGDWFYSPEWWDPQDGGYTVSRAVSNKGNGIVSVVAHPSSLPSRDSWGETEKWLEKRYMEIMPRDTEEKSGRFNVLGYQWRSLRFNDDTRQSTVKVMAACRTLQPSYVFYMQQPHCLAVPYLKSMVSVGLTSLAASKFDMSSVAIGDKQMRVLCIGHGGGSLPLFIAKHILGAVVDIVELDPLVISESVRAMGFPAFSVMTATGKRVLPTPEIIDQVMWGGIRERLSLYESKAEDFILRNQSNTYDLIFMDAYDGADIFPHSLWDSSSVFMKALSKTLHHEHGTLVVNLHSDADISDIDRSNEGVTTGKYVRKVGKAYKKGLLENERNGLVFACEVPWLCNVSLVVSRGMGSEGRDREKTKSNLMKTSLEVDRVLRLPFSCLDYLKTGLAII